MPVTDAELKNLEIGDKVTILPYERVKNIIAIDGYAYSFFTDRLLLVESVDDEYCTLLNEETDETIKIHKKLLSAIYKKESSKVHHPNHYNQNGMEVWDVIKAFTSNLSGAEAFYAGNAIKYILRWDKKNGIEDLEKAKVYIDKIIEGRKDSSK